MNLPGWTCPALDRIERLTRQLPEPQRSAVRLTLEQLRLDHTLLRAAATGTEAAELPAILARVQERLDRFDAVVGEDLDRLVAELALRTPHPNGLAPSTWPPDDDKPV